ncbi:MAG TPA: succinate dehydrogenase, cytochrome b556 subunit [Micropepsaceae bacterium]|nr:succinate dehydrogenase, cytochrome b556 subunit [Micropepsaceae bacterium]
MADAPNSPGPSGRPFGRPLSPHLQIYRWPITMAASITHRATGMALATGTLFLAWWLIAAASGPDAYALFARAAANPVGEVVLFGFLWSISFHLLNGIRHLAWDVGYGFKVPTAKLTAVIVYVGSVLLAAGAFAIGIMVRGGLGT